jgi:hypothetical protein
MLRYWNWKSAFFSAIMRCPIFFVAGLKFGWREAVGAGAAEFVFRAAVSGLLGGVIQSLLNVKPMWIPVVIITFVLPGVGHALEFLVHWFRGTPNLKAGMIGSIAFTLLATMFNWYAMHRGAMIAGARGKTLWEDLRNMPGIVFDFAVLGPLTFWRLFRPVRRPESG